MKYSNHKDAALVHPDGAEQGGDLASLLERPLENGAPAPADGVLIARLLEVDGNGCAVALPGNRRARAQAACRLRPEDAGLDCAVLFINGDGHRPLVMGLLREEDRERPAPAEMRLNGERLVLEAGAELELRCGESVIHLRSDGVIQIRGNYVTSQATAAQRIRGGSVHLN